MKLNCGLVLLWFVCCQYSEAEGAYTIECSPVLDKFIEKGTCRNCPPCEEGRGRNFKLADEQVGNIDNTKCLPCEKCRDGSFNDGRGFRSTCRACTENKCYKLNRYIQRQCTSTSDQICGSCIPGYKDDFHGDHNQPCYRNSSRTSIVASVTLETLNTCKQMLLKSTQQDSSRYVKGQSGQRTYDPKSLILALVLSLICFVLICLLVDIVATYRRCKQTRDQCSDRALENGASGASKYFANDKVFGLNQSGVLAW